MTKDDYIIAELTKAANELGSINCLDYNRKTISQKKVNTAYSIIDKLIIRLKNERGGYKIIK